MKKKILILILYFLVNNFYSQNCNLFCNSDFEINTPTAPANTITFLKALKGVSCWNTTASDTMIEIWGSGALGVPAYSGNYFIELNASFVSTLFQNFSAPPNTNITVSFAHRGRLGTDIISVSVGPLGGPYTTLGTYTTGNTAWAVYTTNYLVPQSTSPINMSLRFNSVYSSGSSPSIGNFLDAVKIIGAFSPNVSLKVLPAYCPHTQLGAANASIEIVSGSPVFSGFTYSWSPSPANSTSAYVDKLTPGIYSLNIGSQGGACKATRTIEIVSLPNYTYSYSQWHNNCISELKGETSFVDFVSSASSPYTYTWLPKGGNNPKVIDLTPGTYTILVADQKSCTASYNVSIAAFTPTALSQTTFPNVFTPNKDGINDELRFIAIEDCDVFSITIFDKWGNKRFETPDIKLKNWNGLDLSGNLVDEGSYFYILTSSSKKQYTGNVYVFR